MTEAGNTSYEDATMITIHSKPWTPEYTEGYKAGVKALRDVFIATAPDTWWVGIKKRIVDLAAQLVKVAE